MCVCVWRERESGKRESGKRESECVCVCVERERKREWGETERMSAYPYVFCKRSGLLRDGAP